MKSMCSTQPKPFTVSVRPKRHAGRASSIRAHVALACAAALFIVSAGPARAASVGYVNASFVNPPNATWSGTGQTTVQLPTSPATIPITASSGANRLMVVVVTAKFAGGPLGDNFGSTPGSVYTVTGTYGTAKLLQAAMSGGRSASPATPVTVWIGYVKEATLPSPGISANLSVTVTSNGPAITAAAVFVGFFANAGGVGQLWPIADSSSVSSSGTANSISIPATIYGPVNGADNGAYVVAAAQASAAAPSVTGYSVLSGAGVSITLPFGSFVSQRTFTSVTNELTAVTRGGASNDYLALAAISINPDSYSSYGDGTPGSLLPVLAIMNPGNGASVSASAVKVQARVFSPKNASGGSQLIDGSGTPPRVVTLSVDGGAAQAMTYSTKYGGTQYESGIWEPTTAGSVTIGTGPHTLQITATNASGTVKSAPITVTGYSSGTGDGRLLVRDNSSQLCNDCHAMPIHSSETSGNAFGSWAVVCRDCHTPHSTTNIYVVRQSVTPPTITMPNTAPAEGSKPVIFYYKTPYTTGGKVGATTAICQGCHSRTTDSVGNPLFRNTYTGIDTQHSRDASNNVQDCGACHSHSGGFPKPKAGVTCHDCHGQATPRADGMTSDKVPPKDTCGNTVPASGNLNNRVGAHLKHLPGGGGTISAGVACSDCHVDPPARSHPPPDTENCSATRALLTWGTLASGGGWTPTVVPSYAAPSQTCSSVYCHGNFTRGATANTPTWNGTAPCGSCHKNSNGTSAAPVFPHPARASDLTGSTCNKCHPTTSGPSTWSTHIDGTLNQTTYGCSQCHGALSTVSPGVPASTPTEAAPGASASGSFDVTGVSTNGIGAVGAHLSHLKKTNLAQTAIVCNECHVVPAAGDVSHGTGTGTGNARATLSWGPLATGTIQGWTTKAPTYTGSNTALNGPNYGTTGGTCGTVFCHGAFPNGNNSGAGISQSWNGTFSSVTTLCTQLPCASSALTCLSCHSNTSGGPQPIPPHQTTDTACGGCHGNAYTWTGTSGTVDRALHMNGKVDGGGGGPNCLGCHNSAKGSRRAVDVDFADGGSPFRSHHVGSGTTNTFKGTLDNYDCVACHMEGQIVTAASADCASGPFPTTCTNPTYHNNKKIDLRDVDVVAPAADGAGTAFVYDKDAVAAAAGAAANWNTGNATWRSETSTHLDPFCLNCHDTDGASKISTFGGTGQTASNPFADTTITNNYDQLTRSGPVDIKGMVAGSPPPRGTYSRHAIRGQAPSRYTVYKAITGQTCSYNSGKGVTSVPCKTMFELTNSLGPLFKTLTSDAGIVEYWNDTSQMGCADCHASDGANGTAGNAHGSTSEYLLKSADGLASQGTEANGLYICVKCHNNGKKSSHSGSTSNYAESVGLVGSARLNKTNASIFGITCINCHGGAPGNGETPVPQVGLGRIHGTSQTFYTVTSTGPVTRSAYRFTNGGALRYFAPGNLNDVMADDASGKSCYTLGAGDSWSNCAQHGSGASGWYQRYNSTSNARPLSY